MARRSIEAARTLAALSLIPVIAFALAVSPALAMEDEKEEDGYEGKKRGHFGDMVDINVFNDNYADVYNEVIVTANTGGNDANGGDGGDGGDSGDSGSGAGDGGAGGDGGVGGDGGFGGEGADAGDGGAGGNAYSENCGCDDKVYDYPMPRDVGPEYNEEYDYEMYPYLGDTNYGGFGGDAGDGGHGGNAGHGGEGGNGAWGGNGGNTGDTGDGGNGGHGGEGGDIATGDAVASAALTNDVNSSDTDIEVNLPARFNERSFKLDLFETYWEQYNRNNYGHDEHYYGDYDKEYDGEINGLEDYEGYEGDAYHYYDYGDDETSTKDSLYDEQLDEYEKKAVPTKTKVNVDNLNDAKLGNGVDVLADSGLNAADGGEGGEGGETGDSGDDAGTGGDGGWGGNGGFGFDGGKAGKGGDGGLGGDAASDGNNWASDFNQGGDGGMGGYGGLGGDGGNGAWAGDGAGGGDGGHTGNTGRGGDAGNGARGGVIVTGFADSLAAVANVVNRSISRIRRNGDGDAHEEPQI